jgi:hypothetical protein
MEIRVIAGSAMETMRIFVAELLPPVGVAIIILGAKITNV